MAAIQVSQTEAERNLHALLSRVDENTSFLIVSDSRPVAILQAVPRALSLKERIARLPVQTDAFMDDGFAEDVQAGIDARRASLDAMLWARK